MPYVIEAFSLKAFVLLLLFASVDQFLRFLSAVELPKAWHTISQETSPVYCYPYQLSTRCFHCGDCDDAERLVLDGEHDALHNALPD